MEAATKDVLKYIACTDANAGIGLVVAVQNPRYVDPEFLKCFATKIIHAVDIENAKVLGLQDVLGEDVALLPQLDVGVAVIVSEVLHKPIKVKIPQTKILK